MQVFTCEIDSVLSLLYSVMAWNQLGTKALSRPMIAIVAKVSAKFMEVPIFKKICLSETVSIEIRVCYNQMI